MSTALHLAHISDYRVVTGADPAQVSAEVTTTIHEGWQPFGSLGVARDADGALVYAQPMVRYAEWYR